MTLYSQLPIYFLDHPSQLKPHLSTLQQASELGIDCESDSFYAYRERLCYLQISTPEALYVIDCLAFKTLSELNPIFSSHEIIKYIHGADFDIMSLKRDYQLKIRGLFDTMIASQVLNCPQVGLGSLVESYFGVKLDKSLTTSLWSKRPISVEMRDYLVNDIRYLIPLGRLLRYHLQRRGYSPIAEELFAQIERKNWVKKIFNPGDFITIKGARQLNFEQRKNLFFLYSAREKVAQKSNQAVYRVLSSKQLLDLAVLAPQTEKEVKTVYFSCPKNLSEAILQAIQEAKKLPKNWEPPEKTPKDPEDSLPQLNSSKQFIFQALKEWRDAKSQEYNLLPWLVSSNKTLSLIAKHAPRNLKQLSKIPTFKGFRLQQFGPELLEQLHALKK